jgi:hypothetical protein
MEDENVGESLSNEEKAYFDSRGEAPVKAEPDPKPEPAKAEPVVELDTDDAEVEASTGTEDAPAQPKTVPLAALTKTRAEAKETKSKLTEAEKKIAVLEDRWNQVLASQQPQQQAQPEAEELPDPDLHPDQALAWAMKQLRDLNEAKKQEAAKTEEQKRAEKEWSDTYTAINKSYTAASEADPLINEARDYLVDSVGNEAMAMGLTREQAQAEISRVEAEHIKFAHKQGLDIGDYVKKLAKARGWNGKAKAPVVQEDPQKQVADLAEAVDASTSLASAGGAAPKTMRAEDIANMSPEQFEKWLQKNPKAFRNIAGG